MEQTKGIIFDLDGTLADTLPLCLKSFQDALELVAGERPSDSAVEAFWGYSETGICKNLHPQDWKKCFDAFLEVYQKNHKMCCELFDGMEEILQHLKKSGLKIALVTGKGVDSCRITLDELGIRHYFDMVETGSEVGSIKPECMRRVLSQWGFAPQEVFYVGDAVSDVTDSQEVGVKTVAAAWAATAKRDLLIAQSPDNIFYGIEEFSDWVKNGFRSPVSR